MVLVTATGGTTAYSGTGSFSAAAGTQNYTVTDANGCTSPASITITQPTALSVSASSGSIACNGGTTSVSLSPSGGTSPYTGTGPFTVSAGGHSYIVTDANGCTSSVSISVTEPTALMAMVMLSSPIACNGGTASVMVSGMGGTLAYSGIGTFTVTAGSYNSVSYTHLTLPTILRV